jgi:hypothetical protein
MNIFLCNNWERQKNIKDTKCKSPVESYQLGERKPSVLFWANYTFFFFFFFFVLLGLELRAFTLSHTTSPFYDGYFGDRVSQTICPGWLQNSMLLISAS